MFETVPSAELPSFPLSEAEGGPIHLWSYVMQGLNMPWYHVELTGNSTSRLLFASHLEQWMPLIGKKKRGSVRVSSVRLVSPGWMNGSGAWRMEPLIEVWRGDEKEAEQSADVFVVEGGRRYTFSMMGSQESQLKGLSKIYQGG